MENPSKEVILQTENLPQSIITNGYEKPRLNNIFQNEAILYGENLGYHLKKRIHSKNSTFTKKNEDDHSDDEKEMNDHTFKSLAQILKLSKKTKKVTARYIL